MPRPEQVKRTRSRASGHLDASLPGLTGRAAPVGRETFECGPDTTAEGFNRCAPSEYLKNRVTEKLRPP
jgi:hypothetical protein